MPSYMLNSYITLARNLSPKKDLLYDPTYYDVWLCPRNISLSGINGTNETLYTLRNTFYKDAMTHLGMLGNLHMETYDTDGMPSEKTYQEIYNIPVSAYMFSKTECTSPTFMQDSCYPDFSYSVYDKRLHYAASGDYYLYGSGSLKNWQNRQSYFKTEYNFSNDYDKGEYLRFDGPKDYLCEENTALVSDAVSLNTDVHNAQGGALLLTWYSGRRVANVSADYVNTISKCDTIEHTRAWSACSGTYMLTSARPVDAFTYGTAAIPCIYYELPLNYKLKNAVVNIQWSENGLYTFS